MREQWNSRTTVVVVWIALVLWKWREVEWDGMEHTIVGTSDVVRRVVV